MTATPKQYAHWQENLRPQQALWLSQNGYAPPQRIVIVDDKTTADKAYRLACAGTSMLWRGDFHNAKQLLQAINRRIKRTEQRKLKKAKNKATALALSQPIDEPKTIPNLFHQKRQAEAQRSFLLSRLLLQLEAGYVSPLPRAPAISEACREAFGTIDESCLLSLRDLQGALGARQWRLKGVPIQGLDLSIYPHYGVFAPTRQEYVSLLLDAPLPLACEVAYDIGTGTGLLAIILAKRGIKQVIATDINPKAVLCAQDNVTRQGLASIQFEQTDVFPTNAPPADLIVCNPPWLPSKPSAPLEYAVYDANSAMLRKFLAGAKQHLAKDGEVWLILSDLAEHLQLRTRKELLGWFSKAGLTVKYRLDSKPKHPRSQDITDPLHEARRAEVTSLWCLYPI